MRSTLRSIAALLVFSLLVLAGCAQPVAVDGITESEEVVIEERPSRKRAAPALRNVCHRAFRLIDNNEPGTVPRKQAVDLANDAFFIDDSVEVTEPFSNLNNVYVFNDGTSSEQEVRAQLRRVCP